MNAPESVKSPFETLAAINVNGHTETKGKFTYLSWPFAVGEISKADPSVTWEFPDPVVYADQTMMVFCNVTAFGKTMRSFLPVMDNRNAPIKNPNAFDINKAYQRCLVKGIALHGLGLYIYAGEDLPEEAKTKAMEDVDKAIADMEKGAALGWDEYKKVCEGIPAEIRLLIPVDTKQRIHSDAKKTAKGGAA